MRLQTLLQVGFATSLLLAGCADTAEIDNKPVAGVAAPVQEAPAAGAKKAAGPVDPAAAVAPAGDAWTVDASSSSIGFLGAKITATHTGGFSDFTGQAVSADGKLIFTKFVVQTSSLWAEEKGAAEGSMAYKLTGHLKSPDFFNVAANPTASFASTSIKYGEGNAATITGNLRFAGKTNSVTFPATIEASADAVKATADFQIKRKDWGLVYPGKPDDLIKDEVALNLNLTFKK